MGNKIIFVDTETGGLKWTHPLIQIGAIVVENNQITEEYEAKLTFEESACDPKALEMNCYNVLRKTWHAQARQPSEAMDAFNSWLRPHCEVEKISKGGKPYKVARSAAYNSKFDTDVLSRTWKKADKFLALGMPYLDVLQLAMWHLHRKSLENFRLQTVAAYLGIENDELEFHDALYDAKMAYKIAQELLGGDVSGIKFGDEPSDEGPE